MQFRILADGLPLWLLLCAAISMPARAATAEELSEVTRLHRAGQSAAALERADRVLSAQPKDAQMRFLKSVVLVDTGRSAEAQAILQQLVQDYPELAEPHNNLAAIYAAAGDYGKSRAELEETQIDSDDDEVQAPEPVSSRPTGRVADVKMQVASSQAPPQSSIIEDLGDPSSDDDE